MTATTAPRLKIGNGWVFICISNFSPCQFIRCNLFNRLFLWLFSLQFFFGLALSPWFLLLLILFCSLTLSLPFHPTNFKILHPCFHFAQISLRVHVFLLFTDLQQRLSITFLIFLGMQPNPLSVNTFKRISTSFLCNFWGIGWRPSLFL